MRKRKGKPVELGTPGGGIGAAFVQDLELTAEQIAEAAEKAVVAVEKIAGMKPSGAGKAAKKVARGRGRKKAAPAKSAKLAKTRKKR